MKKSLYLLMFCVVSSCSLFYSKEELLSKDEWILYSRLTTDYIDGKMKNSSEYFKKGERILTLKFKTDGTVVVRENNDSTYYNIDWEWIGEGKDQLKLKKRNRYNEYLSVEINMESMTWTIIDLNNTKKLTVEIFKHVDDKDWSDDIIDRFRMIKQ